MFLIAETFRSSKAAALVDSGSGRTWSFAALYESIHRIEDELFRDHRYRKPLVFLFCRNDAATVLAYLAAVEAGGAVALFDEAMSAEFRERLLRLYQPELIVSSHPTPADTFGSDDAFSAIYASGSTLADPALSVWRKNSESDGVIHQDLSLLLSTSGSTGTPKLVRLSRRNVESNAHSISVGLGITAGDRPISSLPVHYSYGLSVVNSHLYAGASVILTNEGLTAPKFWETFRTHECTSWAGVPYSYQILRRLGLEKLSIPSLRTLTQAGGRLHPDLAAQFHRDMSARQGRFFVMYGQTEATARIAILPHEHVVAKAGSAGQPIANGRLLIDGPSGLTTEPGVAGEIVYEGPNVMMGYAASRADLGCGDELNGCLRTGDTGYLDSEGFVFLTGRRKRDAKVFGLRINMDEVEEMLRHHGPTAVIAQGEKLAIFCEHGGPAVFAEYARNLASRLRIHAGAFQFHHVASLPLNANGKIDYSKLEAPNEL